MNLWWMLIYKILTKIFIQLTSVIYIYIYIYIYISFLYEKYQNESNIVRFQYYQLSDFPKTSNVYNDVTVM